MANGINWQTLAAIGSAALIGSIGTGGIISSNSITGREFDHLQTQMSLHASKANVIETRDMLAREVNRIDGWIDEVAKKQDQVRDELIVDLKERIAAIEAGLNLFDRIGNLIIRLERLERREENKP